MTTSGNARVSGMEDGFLSIGTSPLQSLLEEGARKQICGGQVLLRIRLACDEVASLKEPAPLFSLQSRLAYLPLLFGAAYEHFKPSLPPRIGQPYEIWFDYNNVALRWHYPLGVLVDVLVGVDVPAPLDLTVHFRGCSSEELLPFSGIGDLQRAVMNSFRQAVFIQHGSSAPFARLPKQQQTRLWDAISASDLEVYSEVLQQLQCPHLSRCKSLAVRLHIHGPPHMVLLHPVLPFENDGETATLLSDFLLRTLPALFRENREETSLVDGVEVLAHGVRIPLDTPLWWLGLHAAYLDHFVHLAVRTPPQLLRHAS